MRKSVLIAAAAILAACTSGGSDETAIDGAWAGATPPGTSVAAAYMKVVSERGDTLLSATTPIADRIEMHVSMEEDGTMTMRPLQTVELAPGRPFIFEPGGAHLMLIGLRAPLVADSSFPLTLKFSKAGEHTVQVRVAAPGSMSSP